MNNSTRRKGIIGLVGPCGAGKSTLQANLTVLGYQSRHIAQEHSFAPDMWRRQTNPDFLIFLDVSYKIILQRKNFNFSLEEYKEQKRRLQHAYNHANLVINTDKLTPLEVLNKTLQFLNSVPQNK
ncbi:MAG TPA: hypothetical protein G4N95_09790 [Anaerolineae bacterium]|nr:hypothetical protein [Anaerolineae bacterium]